MSTLPISVLVKAQRKNFHARYTEGGKPYLIVAEVRHDDECGNGHNTFSITGTVYRGTEAKDSKLESCGCMHEDIAKHFPKLAPLIPYHLTSTDGPMHYAANTVYHAGDRDHWGLRKGEFRQFKNKESGTPSWHIPHDAIKRESRHIDSLECPAPLTVEYQPWGTMGEGKERDLIAARSCAVWPDATDEELTAPGLEDRLRARLPALMAEFKLAVESLGFTY